jgi:Flp pilus assembly protein TadG
MRPLTTLAKAKGGNVAMMFALSIVPLSLATLGAVDLHRAASVRSQLQNALDAAALAAARVQGGSDADIQAVGQKVFNANLQKDPNLTVDSLTFEPTESGSKVKGVVAGTFKPGVMGLVGGWTMAIGADTEVVRANSRLEIAMVLDNTGSMSGTKLSNLKIAAKNFITSMEQAAAQSVETDPVQISIVPFSQTVRVGEIYRNETWIDQNGAAPINNQIFTRTNNFTSFHSANRFTLLNQLGVQWGGCVESRAHPYDIQDTAPSTGMPSTLFTPYFAPDEPDRAWDDDYVNDYLLDRTNSGEWRVRQGAVNKYYLPSDSEVSNSGNWYRKTFSTSRGPNRGCDMLAIMRLSQDWSALRAHVDAMNATGNTNIPIGLVWGWHTLSPNLPFSDGVAYGTPKYKKIVVLMTDGDNVMSDVPGTGNRSRYNGAGYVWQGRIVTNNATLTRLNSTGSSQSTRTAALDYRLQELCKNMKKRDIEIYAVRVEVDTGASTVLQNCATNPGYYYDVQNSSEMDAVFQQIAGQIAALHLSK